MPTAAKTPQETVIAADREVAISNPGKVLFPGAGYTKLDVVRYYLAVSEGALRGAGGRPNMLLRYPNGIGADFFYQKRAPGSRPDWVEVVTLRFPSGRSADEVVPRDEAALADHGLVGWPKTSGSRGMHVAVRIEPRWTFPQVSRAALALAREVERRAPKLATSHWWKEEREGVLLDYNQNAKDRTVAAAYSIRPKPDARVSAPVSWDEVERCDPADFTLATMPARFAKVGDRHAGIDDRPGSLEALLELSARQEREGQGDAPWPPHFAKQAGEPPRVQPSRRRSKTKTTR